MAGINRLGKAPPKPGTLRPADPNRFKSQDFLSTGAENDADYLRAVHEVEETIMRQGYLSARGAFDKGDLLYLRDQAEKQRNSELELRDAETTAFARLVSKVSDEAGLPPEAPPMKKLKVARPKAIVKVVKADRDAADARQPIPRSEAAQPSGAPSATAAGSASAHADDRGKSGAALLGLAYASSSDDEEAADRGADGANQAVAEGKSLEAAKRAAALAGLKALPGPDELLQGLHDAQPPPVPANVVTGGTQGDRNEADTSESEEDSL